MAHPHSGATRQRRMSCRHSPMVICPTAISDTTIIPRVINCSCNRPSISRRTKHDAAKQKRQTFKHCWIRLVVVVPRLPAGFEVHRGSWITMGALVHCHVDKSASRHNRNHEAKEVSTHGRKYRSSVPAVPRSTSIRYTTPSFNAKCNISLLSLTPEHSCALPSSHPY